MAEINKVANLISIIKQTDQQFLDPKGIMLKDILDASGASAQDLFDILNGDKSVEGSVSKAVSDAVISIVDGAPGQLDTLKEISDALAGDEASTATLLKAISDNAAASDAKHDAYVASHSEDTETKAASVEAARVAEKAAVEAARVAEKAAVESARVATAASILEEETQYRANLDQQTDALADAILEEETQYRADLVIDTEAKAASVEAARVAEKAAVEAARVAAAASILGEETQYRADLEADRDDKEANVEAARVAAAAAILKEEGEYRATIASEQATQDSKHSTLKTSHESLDTFVRTNLDLDLDGDGAYDKLSEFLTFVNNAQQADADSIAKAVKDASDANVALKSEVDGDIDTLEGVVNAFKTNTDSEFVRVDGKIDTGLQTADDKLELTKSNLEATDKAVKQDLADFEGETGVKFSERDSATTLYRDSNDLSWNDLNSARKTEASEYQSYKEEDSTWKSQMQETFQNEQALTLKERMSMAMSIDQLVDDKNADSVNSIAEIFNHITEVADINIMNIRVKTDILFTEEEGVITPNESIHQDTLSVKMNGVEVYEGDYTATYSGERLVSFDMERSLLDLYKDGGRLSISGRVGELKAYDFNLSSPFSGQGKLARPISGDNTYSDAIDFIRKEADASNDMEIGE